MPREVKPLLRSYKPVSGKNLETESLLPCNYGSAPGSRAPFAFLLPALKQGAFIHQNPFLLPAVPVNLGSAKRVTHSVNIE